MFNCSPQCINCVENCGHHQQGINVSTVGPTVDTREQAQQRFLGPEEQVEFASECQKLEVTLSPNAPQLGFKHNGAKQRVVVVTQYRILLYSLNDISKSAGRRDKVKTSRGINENGQRCETTNVIISQGRADATDEDNAGNGPDQPVELVEVKMGNTSEMLRIERGKLQSIKCMSAWPLRICSSEDPSHDGRVSLYFAADANG